jgi:hypothetical protein
MTNSFGIAEEGNGKGNSRFPAGMTERKARARATADFLRE